MIKHAAGFDMKMNSGPLDFLAITDHSGISGRASCHQHRRRSLRGGSLREGTILDRPACRSTPPSAKFADTLNVGQRMPEFLGSPHRKVCLARHHRVREETTTNRASSPRSSATEFTSAPEGREPPSQRHLRIRHRAGPSLHGARVPNPEDLWTWMDRQRERGMEALAIPHNSNGSNGTMFERTKWNGQPIDRAWAELRARNEPLAEITQVKGTSETHPLLSPNDEFAGFEIMEWYIGSARTHHEVRRRLCSQGVEGRPRARKAGRANPLQVGSCRCV